MSNLRGQKNILFLLVLLFCLLKSNALQVLKAYTQPMGRAKVGETARLICQSDEWAHYCIWTHESSNCSFRGRNAPTDSPPQPDQFNQTKICSEMKKRVLFKAFHSNDCTIDLKNVTISDQGEWSCQLEVLRAYDSLEAHNNLTLKVSPGI